MREAAGYVLFHGDGDSRRFLLLRNAKHGTWSFPKGHLEEGETAEAGARRELEEETGITDIAPVPGFDERLAYTVGAGSRKPGAQAYEKTVRLFLARAASDRWRRSKEHDEGGWMREGEVHARLQHEDLKRLFARALERLRRLDAERPR
jgi:8-oxo-dGTP pyrophosphatase MutT (NUDIX family)